MPHDILPLTMLNDADMTWLIDLLQDYTKRWGYAGLVKPSSVAELPCQRARRLLLCLSVQPQCMSTPYEEALAKLLHTS